MTIIHKSVYRCAACSWMGKVPGKGRVCKACGRGLEEEDRLPEIEENSPQCKYGKGPFWPLPPTGINPEVRLIAGKINGATPLLYVMIYRNVDVISQLRCPNCNKIARTNVMHPSGQYQDEIICGKTMPQVRGGGRCGARTIYVFESTQIRKDVIHGEARAQKRRAASV